MRSFIILIQSLYGFLYNFRMEGGIRMTVIISLIGLVALVIFIYLSYILLRGDNE
jgi:hypothetical protein